MKTQKIYVMIMALAGLLSSCTKDIDIAVPQDDEKLVVEAYVNNLYPNLNYVLLTKTVNYFHPDFSLNGQGGALVQMSDGLIKSPGDTTWTTFTLKGNPILPGLYTNDSVKGTEGHAYKLNIWLNGLFYTALTTIPKVVPLDSLTSNTVYNGTTPRAFLTVHFQEPADQGQNYRVMFRYSPDENFFAWGDIADSNQQYFNDDQANGIYRHFTYPRTFQIGDTIQYYLANMDRTSYNFWESFESARQNGGPFATPIQLRSNVKGPNVIGGFLGYAISYRRMIFKL